MSAITELFKLDFPTIVIGIFVILSGIIAVYEIIGKFSKIIGKPVKYVRERNKIKELTLQNTEQIKELTQKHEDSVNQSIRHDEIIRRDLAKLTKMFVDKQIDDIRYEILDFASSLSAGRQYSKEQFDHIISIDEKYKKILKENDLENGQVTASMEVITGIYKEKLRTGF